MTIDKETAYDEYEAFEKTLWKILDEMPSRFEVKASHLMTFLSEFFHSEHCEPAKLEILLDSFMTNYRFFHVPSFTQEDLDLEVK